MVTQETVIDAPKRAPYHKRGTGMEDRTIPTPKTGKAGGDEPVPRSGVVLRDFQPNFTEE